MKRQAPAGAIARAAGKAVPRGDGKGYRAAYYDRLGRRRWVSAATEQEAETRRDDKVEVIQVAAAVVNTGTTTMDLLVEWLAKVRPGTRTKRSRHGIKRSSHKRDSGIVHNHIGRYLAQVPVLMLTTEHVDLMIEGLEAEKHLSPRSIEYAYTTLLSGLRWGVSKGKIPQSVVDLASKATLPAVDRAREVPPFSLARTRRLQAAYAGHRLESLFETAASVGPRQGELLAAGWDDIDWVARKLRVRWTLSWREGGVAVREVNKPAQVRSVPLSYGAIAALRRWQKRQAEEREAALRNGQPWPNDASGANYIWTSPNGTPVRGTGTGGATHQLKNALKEAGFQDWKEWNFYVLRHHAASWLLAANRGNLFELMKILGHSSYRQIQDTYGHLVDELVESTMAAAAALLEEPRQAPSGPSTRGVRGWVH